MEVNMKYVPEPRTVTGWHYEAKCLNCETDFHAKRITAKYCSDTCRVMYYFKKKNGKLPDSDPIKKKAKNKTNIEPKGEPTFFKTKADLRSYLYSEYRYKLSDLVIKKETPRLIKAKGKTLVIKRLSHLEYNLYKG